MKLLHLLMLLLTNVIMMFTDIIQLYYEMDDR